MAKGFKDSSGKFHPTGNNGKSSRKKSIDSSGIVMESKQTSTKFTTVYADWVFTVDIQEKPDGLGIIVDANQVPFTRLDFNDSESEGKRTKGKITKQKKEDHRQTAYFNNGKFMVYIHQSDDNPPLGIIIDVYDSDEELIDTAIFGYDDFNG